MKILTIIFLAFLLPPTQQASTVSHSLTWKDIRSEYKGFDQIKPILVNEENQSIYLSRIWPHGYAQLKRFDESSGKWELGEWPGGCGTVAQATLPIEIKPHEERKIEVFWQWSMDEWDNPKFFVLIDRETKRPLSGRYKLVLRYALTPWTVIHHPKKVYVVESQEFQVQ